MKLDTTLYLVTDSTGMTDEAFLQTVCAALKGGVTLLQLREKERSAREYLALAEKVLPLAHEYGVPLLIDDRIDVAIAAGADGAHVGQNDIPVSDARRMLGKGKIVGATAKTPEQAIAAFRQGADYIGAGAVYQTSTKTDTWRISAKTIRGIACAVPIPVNAIGGLNRGNLGILSDTGIAGVCVVSALMKAENPELEAKAIKEAFLALSGRKEISL